MQHTENISKKSFEEVLEVVSENEDAVVVHGWIRHQDRQVLHAWCEIGDAVVDLTQTRKAVPKSAYYENFSVNPQKMIKYQRLEFFRLAAENGHFGPFTESSEKDDN